MKMSGRVHGTKIKICGLKREEDIDYVNEALPDFAGFIVNFPRSRRSISVDTLSRLTKLLSPDVISVGVFVDEDVKLVAELLNSHTIQAAQLHGNEDALYIRKLKALTGRDEITTSFSNLRAHDIDGLIIKAFKVTGDTDFNIIRECPSDLLLLDSGTGSGKTFDWSLIKDTGRDFFLAGGLGADNIGNAIKTINPFGIDLSSSVETDGYKDKNKILAAVAACRSC